MNYLSLWRCSKRIQRSKLPHFWCCNQKPRQKSVRSSPSWANNISYAHTNCI